MSPADSRPDGAPFLNIQQQSAREFPFEVSSTLLGGPQSDALPVWARSMVEILSSIDGHISSVPAIQQEMARTVTEMRVSSNMQAMSGGYNPVLLDPGQALSPFTESLRGGSGGAHDIPVEVGQPADPTESTLPPPERVRVPKGRGSDPPPESVPEESGYDQFQRIRDSVRGDGKGLGGKIGSGRDRGLNLSGLKASTAGAVNNTIGNYFESHPQSQWQRYVDDDGVDLGQPGENRLFNPLTGVMVHGGRARVAAERASNAVGNVARNVSGQMAAGQGAGASIANALPMAGKVAGGAAAAFIVAQQGIAFMESQRAQNAEYQSVLGGSNAEGFGERISSKMFEFSNMGRMGSGQSEALYKGAMGIYGSDRDNRSKAEDIGLDMFMDLGVSVQDTLKLMTDAAKNGNRELRGLTTSLMTVSGAARDAGINANQARQTFGQQQNALAPTVGGETATALAGTLTEAALNLGPEYATTDFSSIFSDSNIQTSSAMRGESASQVAGAISRGDSKAVMGVADQVYTRGMPAMKALFNERAEQIYTRLKKENPSATIYQMGQMMMEEGAFIDNMTPPRIAAKLLSATGTQTSPDNAAGLAVDAVFGGMSVLNTLADSVVAGGHQGPEKIFGEGVSENQSLQGIFDRTGATNFRATGDDQTDADNLFKYEGPQNKKAGKNADMAAYLESARTKGTSPILEKLLADYDPKRRYNVELEDGKKRQVNLGELITSFSDVVTNTPEKVQIAGGGDESELGSNVSQVTGVKARGGMAEATDEEKSARADVGEEGKEIKAKPNNQAKGPVATVQIVADARLNGLFRYLDSKGNPLSVTNAQGLPPEPHQPDSLRETVN